jgi:hypothetical protein
MANLLGKAFDTAPLFDPAQGLLVRAPLQDGPGWWAGAPSTAYDPVSNIFYLAYRLRQPRELGRGIECRIAASDNGVSFTDIWALPKSTLSALSLERAALLQGLDGRWRLYIGHVGPEDRRWRISLLEADEPDQFDIQTLTPILTAEDVAGEGVKDPNVYVIGRMVYMIFSYATAETDLTPEQQVQKHVSGDIYSTGLTHSRTGAAISGDGRRFQYIGDVSPRCSYTRHPYAQESQNTGNENWDAYCRRVTALLPLLHGGYLAFYDGAASVEENYEERTGLALTMDLNVFYSLSPDGPTLRSPHGSGSLRYVDVLPVGHELFYYYEMARPDGSHELRVSIVEREMGTGTP